MGGDIRAREAVAGTVIRLDVSRGVGDEEEEEGDGKEEGPLVGWLPEVWDVRMGRRTFSSSWWAMKGE